MGEKTLCFCTVKVFLLLLLQCVQLINAQQNYTAAVAEFSPIRNPSESWETIMLTNAQNYARLIEHARNRTAQIVIFPEYGLTTLDLPEDLFNVSSVVSVRDNPCQNRNNNSRVLDTISCAANTHNIYTVINLIERETDSSNTTFYYNTNVVFNRNGTIIAKYRKINLSNEPGLTAGNEIISFRTDFGVTFSTFITADILYRTPALDILDMGNVTDIIYNHAWQSETPFLQSLSLQEGYARVAGVNFLVSGYSNATGGYGGAGIFTPNVQSNVLSIQTASGQNIVSGPLPLLVSRNLDYACQSTNPIEIEPRIGGTVPDISAFNTFTEDVSLFTFVELERDTTTIRGEVCSEGSQFCCNYHFNTNQPLTENSTIYKVGAFDGVRDVGGQTTIGVRVCALMACASEEDKTCGARSGNNTTNVVFTFINIVARSEENDETYYQPSTLGFDLQPITNYTSCNLRNADNTNQIEVQLNQPHTSLFSFGVFGRVYSRDGQPPGRSAADVLHLNVSMLIALLMCVFMH